MKIISLENKKDGSSEVVINIKGPLDRGRTATIKLDEFPVKGSAEEAAGRLSEWLIALGKGIKKHNVKRMSLDKLTRYFN